MFNEKQTPQSIGSNSLNNNQAGRDINYIGLSYEDVKSIYYDLFEQNFYKFCNVAREIVDQRCKEFNDMFLNLLMSKNREGLNQAIDPDFLFDIFTAQRDYARCGDPELADMLITLLVERTKETKRSRLQIILNESIATVSKLTREEYDILTLWFVSQYCTESQEFHTLSDLKNFIETYISPFLDSFNNEKSWHTHLVYAGCGFIQAFEVMDIYSIIHNKSASITPKGFKNIFGYLIEEYPNIESFFRIRELHFNETNFYEPRLENQESYMSLTSVGIAIGYANLCNITGEEFNLSKWL